MLFAYNHRTSCAVEAAVAYCQSATRPRRGTGQARGGPRACKLDTCTAATARNNQGRGDCNSGCRTGSGPPLPGAQTCDNQKTSVANQDYATCQHGGPLLHCPCTSPTSTHGSDLCRCRHAQGFGGATTAPLGWAATEPEPCLSIRACTCLCVVQVYMYQSTVIPEQVYIYQHLTLQVRRWYITAFVHTPSIVGHPCPRQQPC